MSCRQLCRFFRAYAVALLLLGSFSSLSNAQATFEFAYSGRLTDGKGKPYAGPVTLSIAFFHDATSTTPVLTVTDGLGSVPLVEGVFQVKLTLSAADYNTVFSDVNQAVYVRVSDLTDSPSTPFARQKIHMVPFAAKVPVDGKTVGFNSDGQLSLPLASQATAGQFLSQDSSGNLVWLAAPTSATSLQGRPLNTTLAPSAGQVLRYDGTQWTATTIASTSGGTVTSVGVNAPLAVTNGASTPQLSLTQATSASNGYLSASDWLNFSGAAASVSSAASANTVSTLIKRDASGNFSAAIITASSFVLPSFDSEILKTDAAGNLVAATAADLTTLIGTGTYVSKAGDTMIGNLSLGANKLNAGTVQTSLQNAVDLNPFGAATGDTSELRFYELVANGSAYMALKAPDAVTTATTLTLPNGPGTAGQVLATTGASGVLSWTNPTTGSVTSVSASSPISVANGSSAAQISLTTVPMSLGGFGSDVSNQTGIPSFATGSATWLTTGTGANNLIQLSSTAKLPGVDGSALTNLAGANLTGTVALANGGTGASTAATARTNLGLGSAATLTAGTAANDLLQLDGSAKLPAVDGSAVTNLNAASFSAGSLNLASSTALTGVLPAANGGTGQTSTATFPTSGTVVTDSNAVTLTNKTLGSTVMVGSSQLTPSVDSTAAIQIANSGGTSYVDFDTSNSRVGIGTVAPLAPLDVSGQIRSKSYSEAATTTSFDLNNGNVQYSDQSAASSGAINVTLGNLLDGSSCTVIMVNAQGGFYTFSATGVTTWKFLPANGSTTVAKDTAYSILRAGSVAYVSWLSGF